MTAIGALELVLPGRSKAELRRAAGVRNQLAHPLSHVPSTDEVLAAAALAREAAEAVDAFNERGREIAERMVEQARQELERRQR